MNFPTPRTPQRNKHNSNLNRDQRVANQTLRKTGYKLGDIVKEIGVTNR